MAAARLDLPALSRELDAFKQRFDKWAQHTVTTTEQLRDAHLRRVRELQATLRSLQQRQAELEQAAADVGQRLASEAAEVEALQGELAKVQAEQAALPGLIAEVQEQLRAEREEYESQASSLSNTEALKERKLAALHQALAMYRTHLGLAFEHGAEDGQRMRLVFTQLDPRDPGRRFTLAVQVEGRDEYAVPACEPPLESAVPVLVAALNARQLSFAQFVQRVRREFKGLVAAEMAAQQGGVQQSGAAAQHPALGAAC